MALLSSIAITAPPTKTAYTVGESFDPAGMVVIATYSDGTTAAVTGYDYKETPLTLLDTSIRIGYFENGVYAETDVAITVTEPEPEPVPAGRIQIQVTKSNGDTLTFRGNAVKRVEYVQSTSFDGNDVQADEMTAIVRQTAPDWRSNWSGVNMKSPVALTHKSRTEKYYHKSLQRVGKYDFEVTAQSPLGRLTDDFPGAIYIDTPLPSLRDVLSAVIGNSIPASEYSINPLLSKVNVYGWIPYQERRMTLHQLALTYGFIIRRDGNNLYFTVPDTDDPYSIPSNATFTGGSVDYSLGRTYARADITAYDYLQREAEAQILFDNTDSIPADKLIVRFDSPMFDLYTDSLRVSDYGANYAEVSGYGRLTGKPYTRIASVVSVDGDGDADPQHILSVSDIPMITSLNAASVGERLLSYHNAPAVVNMDILRTTQRSGDYVSFNDPFGDEQTGYIAALSGSITSFDRASVSVVCGYAPVWGSAYDTVEVLMGDEATSPFWTVPAHLNGKRIRIVLIGGGTGGASGQHGADTNGKGGKGGFPGAGGKILDTTLIVSGGNSFRYECGTGGAGGVASDATETKDDSGDRYYVNNAGQPGTASTFVNLASAVDLSSGDGSLSDFGFYDIIHGTMYAAPGAYDGIDGGDATTGTENSDRTNPDYNDVQRFAVSLPWDSSQSWTSGSSGNGWHNQIPAPDGYIYEWAYGGLGGGAAIGNDGADGGDGRFSAYIRGGDGGSGADAADIFPDSITFGSGGSGGHGGGAGASGGTAHTTDPEDQAVENGQPGSGGRGGNGQNGANGCILIYYKSPDT